MKSSFNFVWIILVTFAYGQANVDAESADYQYYDGSGTAEITNKLNWMENEIKNAVASGCSIQMNSLATYIQTLWWPHIQYLMARIPPQDQQQVQEQYARLQYMIGMRKCASVQETFYQGTCHQIGVPGNPCPKNQQLYDAPDNNGYCYCQRGLSDFVYMNGQCYQQNEQGPCRNGQWLVVNEDKTPACQRVPKGCPADGEHVYWNCGGNTQCQRQTRTNSVSKCSRLGSQQPSCGAGAKLYRSGTNNYCGRPRVTIDDWAEPNVILPPSNQSPCSSNSNWTPSPPSFGIAIARDRQCPRGFNRDPNGKCRKMFAPRY